MRLPVMPPVAPMLAAPSRDGIPANDEGLYSYEPKYDGFRALIFRDGDEVVVQGRSGDDLAYAFPEVVAAAESLPERIVLDGELVVVAGGTLDFEALGSRLRPRSEAGGPSIERLARDVPARYIAFDLLALGDDALLDSPFHERRSALVSTLGDSASGFDVTPTTLDTSTARDWFEHFEGGGLDGLIVKPLADPYRPGKRDLLKVKHQRTLDAVVAGWRPHTSSPLQVGSLLLGLYDEDSRLHHIGVCSGFSARRRTELFEELSDFSLAEGDPHPWHSAGEGTRLPGAVNRWSRGRDSSWHPLRPDLVAEVSYDQFEGDRLRHVAGWKRWRPDRDPLSCTYAQVVRPAPIDIEALLS